MKGPSKSTEPTGASGSCSSLDQRSAGEVITNIKTGMVRVVAASIQGVRVVSGRVYTFCRLQFRAVIVADTLVAGSHHKGGGPGQAYWISAARLILPVSVVPALVGGSCVVWWYRRVSIRENTAQPLKRMKAVTVAALFGALVVGCSTANPIDRFVSHPPQEASKPNVVSLPPDATPERVVSEVLGSDSRHKILESRRVSFGGRVSPTAVLVETEGRKQEIMLVFYAGAERGGWWTYLYDTK
jgi:hypothetical protein